jgi:hypothetical protein
MRCWCALARAVPVAKNGKKQACAVQKAGKGQPVLQIDWKFSDADLISDKDQILPNRPNAFGSAGYWCQRSVSQALHHIAKEC